MGSYMSGTSQARLNGVLGQTSMYETFLVLSFGKRREWVRDRIELIVPHGGKEREEKRWWEVGSIRPGSNEDINVSLHCKDTNMDTGELVLKRNSLFWELVIYKQTNQQTKQIAYRLSSACFELQA